MPTLSSQPNPEDFIYALAAAGETLFAGAASGLYRSDDGGQTWQLATASLGLSEAVPCTSLALSPEFAKDHTVFGGMAGGILRSSDGGRAWALANVPPPPPTATALALSPTYVEDGILDIAAWTHDALILSLPNQILCRPDCAGLCPYCGESMNGAEPGQHDHGQDIDPRWSKLKEIS